MPAETEENRFEALKELLLDDKGTVSYVEAADRLGMTVSAVASAIHRLRARFSALSVEEVANTVNTPEDAEPELLEWPCNSGMYRRILPPWLSWNEG